MLNKQEGNIAHVYIYVIKYDYQLIRIICLHYRYRLHWRSEFLLAMFRVEYQSGFVAAEPT